MKIKWYGYLLATFVLFMYCMGIYDIFMMLSHNVQYYASHNYGQEVTNYFTNYPFYFLILWMVNLGAGILSPLLMFIKNRKCCLVAFISFVADGALILFTSLFRNRIGVLGINVFYFDIFILILTLLFFLYCKYLNKKE